VETYYAIIGFVLLSGLARLLFHRLAFLSDRVPESCLLILLGAATGGLLYSLDDCTLHPECQVTGAGCGSIHSPQDAQRKIFPEFTPTLFFYQLLPPIILEAAFSLHNKVFINNIRTVLLYAVFGTVVNFLLIGCGLILAQVMERSDQEVTYIFSQDLRPPVAPNSTVDAALEPTQVQILLFASLISAVDPVAVLAVFGEVLTAHGFYSL
jgi:hypothetical protein